VLYFYSAFIFAPLHARACVFLRDKIRGIVIGSDQTWPGGWKPRKLADVSKKGVGSHQHMQMSTPAAIPCLEGSGRADFSEISSPRRRSIQLKPNRVGNKNTPLHPVLHGKIIGAGGVFPRNATIRLGLTRPTRQGQRRSGDSKPSAYRKPT